MTQGIAAAASHYGHFMFRESNAEGTDTFFDHAINGPNAAGRSVTPDAILRPPRSSPSTEEMS
ncbi:hypothetical protein DK419_17040 [Methylobacterium terrae]|uniref:Uncharacterized protein n=1 Tax=Methylobacterium terrae TaxID=2202827 RepID=A0A2U8WRI1_9HYPH|nr:hypothetical protein DK419_17040 [Methylobacterium terrae]